MQSISLRHPAAIIDKIANLSGTGSKKQKSDLVEQNLDNSPFVKTIQYALDPFRQFFTTTIPGLNEIAAIARRASAEHKRGYRDMFDDTPIYLDIDKQFEAMFSLLDDLSSRKLPPNSTQSRQAICEWARKVDAGTIKIFRLILHKDLRCGMQQRSFNSIKKDWIPTFKVQLAKPFNPAWLKFPCFVDPKFDGERCLAQVIYDGDEGSITYFSRNGNQFFNYGTFDAELLKLFRSYGSSVVDCEAISKLGFQHSQRTPKFHDPNYDTSNMQLMIFDLLPLSAWDDQSYSASQTFRLGDLTRLFKNFKSDKIMLVDTRLVADQAELEEVYAHWVSKGLEGVICKQPEGKYEFKRSSDWMKIKPSESEDLVIVDIEEGDANKQWAGKTGSLIVERTTQDGKTIRIGVASGLTHDDHKNINKVGDQILYKTEGGIMNIKGRLVEVVFDCVTEDGSLRFPRVKNRGGSIIRAD